MEYKLPKKIKTRWLNDLRSGKFKQGNTRLLTVHEDGSLSFCCLGVLATQWNDHTRKSKRDRLSVCGWLVSRGLKIPKVVERVLEQEASAKLKKLTSYGSSGGSDVENALINLNDTKERSFKHIANIIEKHL